MNRDDELHVVFGGSGGLGGAVVRELVKRGKRVRSVSRSGGGSAGARVEAIRGNLTDIERTIESCRGASVIYHCANTPYPEWVKSLPAMMDGVIVAARTSGAKVVYGDNVYMYGPVKGPIIPELPDHAPGPKGRVRAEVAARLMRAHREGSIQATIGRASDFFGPGVLNSMMGKVVFQALVKEKPPSLIGKLDVPHTYTFVRDFAEGLVTLGEREEAIGEIWHVPSAETLTTRQFLELIFAEARQMPKLQVLSPSMLTVLGLFNPILREIKEILYEFEQPFIIDHGKYERAFGSHPTPHPEAIRQTLDWFSHRPLPG